MPSANRPQTPSLPAGKTSRTSANFQSYEAHRLRRVSAQWKTAALPMASSTMQTCHLPRETRLAPRKPVAYSQRKMPANRVSNPRRDCWPQLPRKLHHPPGGAPKAPRVRGSRSLLTAAADQENSIPQRLVETKPRNFFSFLYTLRHSLLTMPAFPALCDAIDLAGDGFVRRWSQTCASPYNASDSIGG